MENNLEKSTDQAPTSSESEKPTADLMLERIIGCKWSLAVLMAIRDGVHRPGELERHCAGISNKVLHQRLRKLERFELIERHVHAVVPPHVEYHLSSLGMRFQEVLRAVDDFQRHVEG